MATVLVPLADGFEEIEAVAIIDVMRRAGIEVIVASVLGNETVVGAQNIALKTDRGIGGITADDLDMIVLPGGWGGTDVLASNDNVQMLLKEMNRSEKPIGAICAAPYALHTADVLKENFTCYPSVEEKIRTEGYDEASQVVEDGNVMTSRGPGTALCFGLQIVKKLCGEETYAQLRQGLLATYCD